MYLSLRAAAETVEAGHRAKAGLASTRQAESHGVREGTGLHSRCVKPLTDQAPFLDLLMPRSLGTRRRTLFSQPPKGMNSARTLLCLFQDTA